MQQTFLFVMNMNMNNAYENIIFYNENSKILMIYELNGVETEFKLDNIPVGFKPIEWLNEDLVYFDPNNLCLRFMK